MRTNKGFTLIEVMVVLSILAIMAILAYNFFGLTIKEAVTTQAITKINNDLNVLDQAMAKYDIDTGSLMADGVRADDLVGSGHLKAEPVMPASAKSPSAGSGSYFWYKEYDELGGPGATHDPAWMTEGMTDESCIAYNDRYCKACGAAIWSNLQTNGEPTPYPANEITFCVTFSDVSGENYATLIHRLEK